MKLKKKGTGTWSADTGEFWYDLTDGGYLNPEDYLSAVNAQRVNEAIALLRQFEALVTDYAEETP